MAPTTRSRTANVAGLSELVIGNRVVEYHGTRPTTVSSTARRKVQTRTEKLSSPIPVYQIDLSKPPAERYTDLARDFQDEIKCLPALFDDVVSGLGQRPEAVHRWARRLLRRIHSDEQTEELRGISVATGVPMYLLVCFNTLLDLFMGCSSGGIRTENGSGGCRMLHYRTLDWGMDLLRKVIVELEFMERPKGPVIARSITYAGFVGILTGVREKLSLSLNFRPCHNNSDSKIANVRFYGHLLLVLLGWRPSISSKLRDLILPGSGSRTPLSDIASIIRTLPAEKTTAAYLIFSDGDTTAVLEKDLSTANVTQSSSFISCTNHDASAGQAPMRSSTESDLAIQRAPVIDEQFLSESADRKECMDKLWQQHVATCQRRQPELAKGDVSATEAEVVKWVQKWPVTNESTHFACVMDPANGEIRWARFWSEPLPHP